MAPSAIGLESMGLLEQRLSDLSRARLSSLWIVSLAALAIGVAAAISYHVQDLTLSHYDAKAHLVVARRIVDSMRPGWMQIGAVWLPLPHLLNLIPVQVDTFYRTGLSAVVFSVIGFVVGAVALWKLVVSSTGSVVAGWAAFAVFAAHPDVLYLQATPMTESLLMGLCLLGVALTWTWLLKDGSGRVWPPGLVLALACLTRYEAWPITASAVAVAALVLSRKEISPGRVAARITALALLPAAAVLGFLILSRLTVGSWLVTSGFFEIDRSMYHEPGAVLEAIWSGVRDINGEVMTTIGTAGLIALLVSVARRPTSLNLLIVVSLAACVALPLFAFWNGHPFRLRYMVPLTMALAAFAGIGVGLLPHYRGLAAAVITVVALIETPPLSSQSPMVLEAQRDAESVTARRRLTECLLEDYDRTPILASMESLAPYMQETAQAGFSIRQFLHEGTGQLWADSLQDAGRHAGWVLIEEEAEGGDVLARLSRRTKDFLSGFERQCAGGSVTLYRRIAPPPTN